MKWKRKQLTQIRLTFPNLETNNLHYIITVPVIWDLKSKNKMFKASQNAGLIWDDDDYSNFFTLEPEAASIYLAIENDGKRIYECIIRGTEE